MSFSSISFRSRLLGVALLGLLVPLACSSDDDCEKTRSCKEKEEEEKGPLPSGGGAGGEDEGAGISCARGLMDCGGSCVDPLSSVAFCGAVSSCEGENSGQECDGDEECVDGECVAECDPGFVRCDGVCIDPLTDKAHCGAKNDCSTRADAGSLCLETESCVTGQCMGWSLSYRELEATAAFEVDAGIDDAGRRIVVWIESRGLRSVFFDPETSTWSPPSDPVFSDGGLPTQVALDVDESGLAVVAWRRSVGDDNSIHAMVSDGTLSFGSLFSDQIPEICRYSLGSLASGGETVGFSFFLDDGGPCGAPVGDIYLSTPVQAFQRPAPLTAPAPFVTSIVFAAPRLGIDSKGRRTILYQDAESLELHCADAQAEDDWTRCASPVDAFGDVGAPFNHMALDISPSGAGAALWHRDEPLGVGLYVRPRTAEGVWGEKVRVVDLPAIREGEADVEVRSNGDVLVVWVDANGVNLSSFSASTEKWVEPPLVLSDNEEAFNVRVAVSENGDAVVGWQDSEFDGGPALARRYEAASGEWQAEPVVLAQDPTFGTTLSALEMNAWGEILAAGVSGGALWYNAFTFRSN